MNPEGSLYSSFKWEMALSGDDLGDTATVMVGEKCYFPHHGEDLISILSHDSSSGQVRSRHDTWQDA